MSRKPVSPKQPPRAADDEPVGEALAAAQELAAARKRWTLSPKQIGIGAAVGVGSAAIVAALLYWRGNRR